VQQPDHHRAQPWGPLERQLLRPLSPSPGRLVRRGRAVAITAATVTTSREITDGSRPTNRAISLNCKPSTRPREISSRFDNINIARTAGILSRRTTKIKRYDRLLTTPFI